MAYSQAKIAQARLGFRPRRVAGDAGTGAVASAGAVSAAGVGVDQVALGTLSRISRQTRELTRFRERKEEVSSLR